ncbi:hypothetical protein SKUN_001161 [Spiroplasma kunkelii CR2-3x]|uniref:Uncharacterized protein n=1 Tax=Spiroplasma kunkelii CR2-3x TaxID=273035 RepID=A0A0K2JHZ3_SPIKU|nr:hypothetical protein [Spiroplasma kunkelii]ALA97505.1 hypothetical protein SKUN_00612 [Spiroplasma kunkelii CR2-3x]ALA98047.1 hypothetical protein SKUN_001161 [Spiroplasma kunkelii CR2-3x]
MEKRYILISKISFDIDDIGSVNTEKFYTLAEAKVAAKRDNKGGWLTTIIDLENKNIEWQGDK